MNKILNFYDLEVWQQAHKYRPAIFKSSNEFPQRYQFSLAQQLQRAAISIGANIAEGFGRHNIQEKKQFYRIARGSLVETQDQLLLAKDLGLVSIDEFENLWTQSIKVHQLPGGLLRSIGAKAPSFEFRVTKPDGAASA